MADPKPILIDTDPGVDDAMAILYAIAEPRIELLGLTTVFGNLSVERATRNALQLLELAGVNVPVAQGAGMPLKRAPAEFPDFIHGVEGFGDELLPPPQTKPIENNAAAFIVETLKARPGEVTLMPIGPLTNIADALALDPSIVEAVDEVVIMGGAGRAPGNVNAYAEANIWNDPDAAEAVFAAPWKIKMVGLDVTTQVRLPRGALTPMRASSPRCGPFLDKAVTFYIDFHLRERRLDCCYMHDPAAVIAAISPELFEWERHSVHVDISGEASGRTAIAPLETGRAASEISFGVDSAAVLEQFLSQIGSGRLP